MTREWLVGIDIGGTFTDVVALHQGDGRVRTAKVPSRPHDPVGALLDALQAVSLDHEFVSNLIHGTTRITNAIVEGKLPPVALLTTHGFEDVLAIARLRRRELYRLDVPPKLPPLVPSERTVGVVERVTHHAQVLRELTAQEVERVVARVAQLGVSTVAVSLLHAYANPTHERVLGQALASSVSHVSLSHRVNPEAREYERTSSTVLNAAATPVVVDYLDALLDRVPLNHRLQLFHSAGGWATPEAVREHPLVMAMSGPAAGVAACARMSQALQRDPMLTFDMGGTTTDVCLVVNGEAQLTDQREIAGRAVRQPMLAIDSIGAGGGSIVRLSAGGLSVGPDSAGAHPGPACYGLGGQEPTVTDANAVLGYLDGERRLGGAIHIDRALAEQSLAPIAAALGRSVVETALGVVRVANATMARALRRVTVERGIDGRRCTLLAFGGAGPMHAVGLSEEFGLSQIVVPAVSSAFSAYGCLLADAAYTQQRTLNLNALEFDQNRFESARDEMVTRLLAPLSQQVDQGATPLVELTALMRYEGQSSTVAVPMQLPLELERLGNDFTARHQDLYGYATSEPWLLEALRVRVSIPSAAQLAERNDAELDRSHETVSCWFEPSAATPTARWSRDRIGIGQTISGPAIIEDAWSTVIVPPGWTSTTDRFANLILSKEPL